MDRPKRDRPGGGRGKKRRVEDGSDHDEDENASAAGGQEHGLNIGQQVAHIKDKTIRREKLKQLKHEQKRRQRESRKRRKKEHEKALEAGSNPGPRQVPRTIELVREKDETTVPAEGDEEVDLDEEQDEFAEHFHKVLPPKVLITTNHSRGKRVKHFILELLRVFPIAIYYERGGYPLKKIVEYAKNENFTDILVINQDRKEVNAMMVIHLPEGPTALFRVRNLKLQKEIRNCGEPTTHKPELILNNFDTRLGHRIGRMFASLFHQAPQFRGRQVVTFHNLRDYVFVRHHRYVFEEKEKKDKTGRVFRKLKTRLQELGPRFTLKLMTLQKGTFDSKYGEFEWVKKKDMKAKRRYFL